MDPHTRKYAQSDAKLKHLASVMKFKDGLWLVGSSKDFSQVLDMFC